MAVLSNVFVFFLDELYLRILPRVEVGSNVDIKCDLSEVSGDLNNPTIAYWWSNSSGETSQLWGNGSSASLSVVENDQSKPKLHVITLKNIAPDAAGDYWCRVLLDGGEVFVSREKSMTVVDSPMVGAQQMVLPTVLQPGGK